MKSIIAANCLLLALVSCGSGPISRPFVVEIPAKVVNEQKKPKLPKVKSPAEEKSEPKKKAFAGRVTFQGLTSSQLGKIRIIPEAGSELMIPMMQSYDQVDGLWVMGAKVNEWFKIPDYSEAWVGKSPEKFDGTAHLGDLKIYYRNSPVLRLVGAMKKGLKHPAWVPDSGATKSPVPSPWKPKR